MLFVGSPDGQALTPQRAAELMRGVEPGEIAALVDQLNGRYAAGACPYRIVMEQGGYRLTLRKPFQRVRDQFERRLREARLSLAAINVLAIVAYRQPISGEEVGGLRGKPSGAILGQLVRRGLLRVERKEGERTPYYRTAERFLKLFSLRDLRDLPQSEDLEAT